jgi:hypothetical protein
MDESQDSRDKYEENLGNKKLTRICSEEEPKCCSARDNRHCCSAGIQIIYFVSIAIIALLAITFASIQFIVCFGLKIASGERDIEQIIIEYSVREEVAKDSLESNNNSESIQPKTKELISESLKIPKTNFESEVKQTSDQKSLRSSD